MQFVFDHTTFDPANPMDQAVLAAYEPLGVVPGRAWDPARATQIGGERLGATAERVRLQYLGTLADPVKAAAMQPKMFQPKGTTDLETVLAVSIIGPIGLPQEEAVYPRSSPRTGSR